MALINFQDLIEFLTSTGNVSSSLGTQLERMKDGTSGTFTHTGVNNEEFRLLSKASILRCVDGLRSVERIEFESCPSLRAFAKRVNASEGPLVLAVIGAYHKWYLKSEMRGLVEVYRVMQRLDPSLPEPDHSEDSLSQSFRTGKTKKARDKASKLLKDSLLAIDSWINKWNEQVVREQRKKNLQAPKRTDNGR